MASTAAERKAEESKRKAELNLKRKAFWLNEESIKIIESYKAQHSCTNDEAINQLLKSSD